MPRALIRSLLAAGLLAVCLVSAAGAGATSGNKVEPLSNGLTLTMTANQVIARFGAPLQDDRSIGGGIGYRDFGIMYNTAGTEIWTFTITGKVSLASGITVGSSRSAVRSTFPGGSSTASDYTVTYQQYALDFIMDGNTVWRIKIEPANRAFQPITGSPAVASVKKGAFLGTWYGTNVPVRIVVRANGTYLATNGAASGSGRYMIKGRTIIFKGKYLYAWNHGQATLSTNGALEFYWKSADGAIHYFAFVKR